MANNRSQKHTKDSSGQKRKRQETPKELLIAAQKYGTALKWYKFLIYFSLFASAVSYAFTAFVYISLRLNESDPLTSIIFLIAGGLCAAIAIFAIVTRQLLAHLRKKAPNKLITFFILSGILGFATSFITLIKYEKAFTAASAIMPLVMSTVMAIVNHIYFKKRNFLFRY